MIRVATIIGARPQFIKAAMVTKAFAQFEGKEFRAPVIDHRQPASINEIIIHTGQHYDANMSQVFFAELGLPSPHYNLGVGSATHGKQTGLMLMYLEESLVQARPDVVLTYGDTNSTLAGALAATKLHIPLVHIEAGLRSFNKSMPEEINRILTDHAADLLFCPTQTAVHHLRAEGITEHVYQVGDVMYDAALYFAAIAERRSSVLADFSITEPFYLATVHRQENTDNLERLTEILTALNKLKTLVIFPLHPRTDKVLQQSGLKDSISQHQRIRFLPPVSFLDMLVLEKQARLILTDSGGVQKEAFFFNVPCITLRDETEWVETVVSGMNVLTGARQEWILNAVEMFRFRSSQIEAGLIPPTGQPFGDGQAAGRIVEILWRFLQSHV